MRRRARAHSPSTTAIGREAERRAQKHLRALGFSIVETNFRNAAGEIDIIAREGDVLCFVEVRARTRPGSGDPLESITYEKRRRIERAAEVYLADFLGTWPPIRFDVVAVRGTEVELLRNAFETG